MENQKTFTEWVSSNNSLFPVQEKNNKPIDQKALDGFKDWLIGFVEEEDLKTTPADVLDEMDAIETIMEFEKRLNCAIPDDDYVLNPSNFNTLEEYVDYLVSYIKNK